MAWLFGSSNRGVDEELNIIAEFSNERESLDKPKLFHRNCSPSLTMNLRKLKESLLHLLLHSFRVISL
jgi:hypothetical protein